MSALFDTLSDEVFQILKGTGKTLTLYDINGNRVYEPSQARTVFVEPDKMVLGIEEKGDDSEMNLYLSNSVDVKDPKLEKLINTIRHISTRYNVLLNVRKFGRELTPKDFAFKAQPVAESFFEAMWGTSKTSYQKVGDSKIIVRHCSTIREEVRGARSRRILSLFVETKSGERFKFPINHLSGARAWAQHLSQNGKPHDEMGSHIVENAIESQKLAALNSYIHYNRKNLDADALSLRYPIRSRMVEIRKNLSGLSKPNGYTKALEAQSFLGRTLIQESQTVSRECSRLGTLLGIDSNHALSEHLQTLANLTIGETKMFNNADGMFHRVITLENANAMADLAEALVNEYGHDEFGAFTLEEGLMTLNETAFSDAVAYLGLIAESYNVFEDEDKFVTYASQWIKNRLSKAGEKAELGPEQEQQAHALADGLKGILSGKAPGHPVMDGNPRFANPQAELAYKVGSFLDAKSGMKNDALWTYISNIVDHLQHGKKLSSTEQMFATKLAHMASNANESIVDETIFNEATPGNDDPDHINYGSDDQAYEDAATEVAGDFAKYYLNDFVRKFVPEFLQSGAGEDPASSADTIGELTGFLRTVLANDFGVSDAEPKELAKQLFPQVQEFAGKNGWKFDHDLDEAYSTSREFKTSIDFDGDDDHEVKVVYSPDDEYVDIEQVISLKDNRDITNQLDQNIMWDLAEKANQEEAERHAEHLDNLADMKRDRMMGEDMGMLNRGDHVATPMGPGVVQDIEGDVAIVDLMHGATKQFHLDDVEKVDVDAEMGRPKMHEEIELEKWFEQFDPETVTLHAALAPAQMAEQNVEEADLEQLEEYGANSFESKDPTIQKLVKYLRNNWELAQASPDKLAFNKTLGKTRFKLTVTPDAVILDKFSETDLLAHKRFGAGGEPMNQLASTMQSLSTVREDFRIDETEHLPDLEDLEDIAEGEEIGGDMEDDLKDEITNKADQEQVEEAAKFDTADILRLAGLTAR